MSARMISLVVYFINNWSIYWLLFNEKDRLYNDQKKDRQYNDQKTKDKKTNNDLQNVT
jgi:hypothetical protein